MEEVKEGCGLRGLECEYLEVRILICWSVRFDGGSGVIFFKYLLGVGLGLVV